MGDSGTGQSRMGQGEGERKGRIEGGGQGCGEKKVGTDSSNEETQGQGVQTHDTMQLYV